MSGLTKTRTAAEWQSRNPVLYSGQIGFEEETGRHKVGNGTARWNDLSFVDGYTGYVVPEASWDSSTNLPSRLDESELNASFVRVVEAGTNLSTARPANAKVVMWRFSAGVDVGDGGANVVNRQAGDLIFVAS